MMRSIFPYTYFITLYLPCEMFVRVCEPLSLIFFFFVIWLLHAYMDVFWHLSSWCSRAFWINALVSYIILEILLFIGLLNILSLFLSWHLHHACYIPLIIVSQYLNVLFFFFGKFLFYLLSNLGGFYWDTLALSSETLSSAMTSLLVRSSDVFLISVILSFIYSFLFLFVFFFL